MVNSPLLKVFHDSLNNFCAKGWPNCLLVSGPQSPAKFNEILSRVKVTLLEDFQKYQKENRTGGISLENAASQIDSHEYADLYIFEDERIAIGENKNPGQGSVRHLLQHFLPFSPKYASQRFIIFKDAAKINNEAETALLKSLEEPPWGTHFILLCEQIDSLKDTILSRSLQLQYQVPLDVQKLSGDSWQKFWYLSGYEDSALFYLMQEQRWLDFLSDQYDQLNFNKTDYPIFDRIFFSHFKKTFDKSSNDVQAQLLRLSLLPLYFALRDSLMQDKVETLGPLRLPRASAENLLRLAEIIQDYFIILEKRIFNTMTHHLNTVTAQFLSQFMQNWNFKN